MRFAKKHYRKGLKKMQANNAKAASARMRRGHQGPGEASVHQAQDAKGPQPQTQPPGFHRSPQAWEADSKLHGQGSEALPTKARGSNQGRGHTAPAKAQASAPAQAPKGAQAPVKAPWERLLSASVKTDGLLGHTYPHTICR
ncbi:mCG51950 [Mus musculus]|nr:mCG51950 [Mus musculus]